MHTHTVATPEAACQTQRQSRTANLDIIPTITSLNVVGGQLLAAGTATANWGGRTYTAPFSDVPVTLAVAPDQTGTVGCPILNLQLGPIDLDLLGLVVETSPICLRITAVPGGGLLGDLLCAVANLLGGGLNLPQIVGGQGLLGPLALPGFVPTQIPGLLGGLTNLLNAALDTLLGAVVTGITPQATPGRCPILNLALGPVDLNLLGLDVELDNCAGGPVTVDITAVRGALLGNLLCALLGGGQVSVGTLLSDILNRLLPGR